MDRDKYEPKDIYMYIYIQMDGWMDGGREGWMDRQIHVGIHGFTTTYPHHFTMSSDLNIFFLKQIIGGSTHESGSSQVGKQDGFNTSKRPNQEQQENS